MTKAFNEVYPPHLRRAIWFKQSIQMLELLRALVRSPSEWRYGYELSKSSGLRRGTIYAQMLRLESAGVLEAWQGPIQRSRGRQRRMFRLTEPGHKYATELLTREGWL